MFKDIFNNLVQTKGITAYKMSKETGISESLISNWKSGRQLPNYDSLKILADYFNVSGDYLLGRADVVDYKQTMYILNPPEKQSQKKRIPSVMLNLYDQPASAGTGNYIDSDVPTTWVSVAKTNITVGADFLIRVRGDSMRPKFNDGDIVAIKKSPTINEGEIGVFVVNGDSYIKKMGNNQLVSLNQSYNNIVLSQDDDARCIGLVLGIAQIV